MKTLIAYFSRTGENYFNGVIRDTKKGNTEILAEQIHEIIKSDIYKIEPLVPYSDNYRECCEQSRREKLEQERPPLRIDLPNASSYDTVFLGFPCWWGTVPMAVVTFLEANRINGKKIIPFVTHEGSGIEIILKDLKKICPNSEIYEPFECLGSNVSSEKEKIQEWLNSCQKKEA